VKGVIRGGRYDNRSSHLRCAGSRLSQGRGMPDSTLGFRFGVFRGGRAGLQSRYIRCGLRNGSEVLSYGGIGVGFRSVNGVDRGGSSAEWNNANHARSAMKSNVVKTMRTGNIGFRCEWCREGW